MIVIWIIALISSLLLINAWFVEYMEVKVFPYAKDTLKEDKRTIVKSIVKLTYIVISSIMWSIIIVC